MKWNDFLNEAIETTGKYRAAAPQVFEGFSEMGKAAKRNGALSEKNKELIALGIAIATHCDFCIAYHVKSLVRLQTTRDEFCEALEMISYMGGGPSISYGARALDAFDQFST